MLLNDIIYEYKLKYNCYFISSIFIYQILKIYVYFLNFSFNELVLLINN